MKGNRYRTVGDHGDFLESSGIREPRIKLSRNAATLLEVALCVASGQPVADLWIQYQDAGQEFFCVGLVACITPLACIPFEHDRPAGSSFGR